MFGPTYTDGGEREDGGGAEEHVREDPEEAGGWGQGPPAPHLHTHTLSEEAGG